MSRRITKLNDNLQIADMDIPDLEKEIRLIEQEERACLSELSSFLARENPAEGIFFAGEIHTLKQNKLRLNVEKEFCRKRIARLKFEAEDLNGAW